MSIFRNMTDKKLIFLGQRVTPMQQVTITEEMQTPQVLEWIEKGWLVPVDEEFSTSEEIEEDEDEEEYEEEDEDEEEGD